MRGNDLYVLGREEKKCTPPMRDVGSGDDSEDPLDPSGSTQMLVTAFPGSTVIKSTATCDSISITVTDTGKVYGWGTFRYSDSILRFNEKARIQSIPVLLSTLKNIVLQFQPRRCVVEGTRFDGLTPREFGLPRPQVKYAATVSCHSLYNYQWRDSLGVGTQSLWLMRDIRSPTYWGRQCRDSRLSSKTFKGHKIVQVSTREHHSATAIKDVTRLASLATSRPHMWSPVSSSPSLAAAHAIISPSWGRAGALMGPRRQDQTRLSPDAEDEIIFLTELENAGTGGIKMVFSDAGGQFPILPGISLKHTNGTV
ncbi:hypothetical protein HOY82DRAFT_633101 [Tuber indicum]|nr:hypothetical protein HOY82DRAFT_633101 [Tuber indicum]